MKESVLDYQDSTALTNGRLPLFTVMPAKPKPPGVNADIPYLEPMGERPFNYMFEPPSGAARQNCMYKSYNMRIADARANSLAPDIQQEGFELWDAPTCVEDFSDEEAIRTRYYPEAAELARLVTGADKAYVFDHLVRRRETGRPVLSFGRHGDGSRPGAAGRVHNDYSEGSGLKRLEIEAHNFKIQQPVRRFSIVNIWRSIGGRVVDTPLAICDARSVSASDLVTTDIIYPNRTGEIYLLHHSPHHQWSYYPAMDRREALVFKQYDSQASGIARFAPHSAFDLPDIPADAPLRQSIEVRCLVTYG